MPVPTLHIGAPAAVRDGSPPLLTPYLLKKKVKKNQHEVIGVVVGENNTEAEMK